MSAAAHVSAAPGSGHAVRRRAWLTGAVAAAVVLSGCGPDYSSGASDASSSRSAADSSGPADTAELDSMVVLGHSGATGFDSGTDTTIDSENSWATGTNPDVNSIYLRLLATHPGLEGHNYNVAVNGSSAADMLDQARIALRKDPLPDLVLIQTVDNDIACTTWDEQSYGDFATNLRSTLDILTEGLPDAQIVIVSSPWGTEQNYADVVAASGADLTDYTGESVCDLFDATGAERPAAIADQQRSIDGFLNQLRKVCGEYRSCRYDDEAFRNVVITVADMSPDLNHASIAGHAKLAAAIWPMFS